MVKKLFKHEAIAYLRALLPMYLVVLGISALTRFVYIFETESNVFGIIGTSSVIALIVGCVVALVMTFVNVITRFYKNMFTNEGYLSFTLPVTTEQHILVKLITGVISIIASLILVFVSVCIATSGQMTVELFKVVGYLFKVVPPLFEGHFWFYFVEIIVYIIFALFNSILLFYACIAVGQLSKKNRKVAAIGIYFAYYFAVQIVETIFIVVLSELQNTEFLISVMSYIEKNSFDAIHIGLCIGIAFCTLLSVAYFAVTNYIMRRKLNLE